MAKNRTIKTAIALLVITLFVGSWGGAVSFHREFHGFDGHCHNEHSRDESGHESDDGCEICVFIREFVTTACEFIHPVSKATFFTAGTRMADVRTIEIQRYHSSRAPPLASLFL
ncbi:MAG TPA: hypothetical protein ENN43_08230 [bacterium]|nr:hypothetical protein [bacterium]